MNSDAHYAIGSTHTVCQDYARAGSTQLEPGAVGDRCFALVADGCSSSAHSDLGARFLLCAAMHALAVYGDRVDADWLIWRAAAAADSLGIDRACLDATLLAAWQCDDGSVQVWAAGDGVVAARRRDGRIETWTIDDGGAPGYLAYRLSEARRDLYLREGFGERKIVHALAGEVLCEVRSEAIRPWTLRLDPKAYELIALVSDGVASFERVDITGREQVAPMDVLEQLLAVKSTRGEFLLRRARRFLTRFCNEENWQHSDDLAVAAIVCGEAQ